MSELSIKPLFIAGCARSGTTMLGDIVGAHPQCLCTPESQFVIYALRKIDRPLEEIKLGDVYKRIQRYYRYKFWGIELNDHSLIQQDGKHAYPKLIERLVRLYGKKIGKPEFSIWADHTPNHIKYIRTLFTLFPQAKLVHLVRDGRAVAASIIPLDWGPNTIVSAAHWWMEYLSFGLAAESHWGPDRILRMRYEDILAEPEKHLQMICRFVGIDYQHKMLLGGGFRIPHYTAKQHPLVGQRPDSSRINAWRKTLSRREIEIFEILTSELLTYLSYPRISGLHTRKISRMERRKYAFKDWYRSKFKNKSLFKRRRAQAIKQGER